MAGSTFPPTTGLTTGAAADAGPVIATMALFAVPPRLVFRARSDLLGVATSWTPELRITASRWRLGLFTADGVVKLPARLLSGKEKVGGAGGVAAGFVFLTLRLGVAGESTGGGSLVLLAEFGLTLLDCEAPRCFALGPLLEERNFVTGALVSLLHYGRTTGHANGNIQTVRFKCRLSGGRYVI
jgi:hypothetical protein